MKVIDIISSNNLQEAGLLATGAKAAYQGLKGAWDSRSLVNAISQHPGFMEKILKGKPPSVAKIESVFGKAAADIMRNDDTIIAKALKQYQKEQNAVRAAGLKAASSAEKTAAQGAGVVGAVKAGGNVISKVINYSLLGTMAAPVFDVITDAVEKIQKARATIKDNPDDLHRYEHQVINSAIARLSGILIINGALAMAGFGFAKVLPSAFGWLMQQTTKLGIGWFNLMAADPRNKDGLITAWVISIIDSIVGLANPYVPNPEDLVKKAASSTPEIPANGGPASSANGQGANPADRNASSTPPVPGTLPKQPTVNADDYMRNYTDVEGGEKRKEYVKMLNRIAQQQQSQQR